MAMELVVCLVISKAHRAIAALWHPPAQSADLQWRIAAAILKENDLPLLSECVCNRLLELGRQNMEAVFAHLFNALRVDNFYHRHLHAAVALFERRVSILILAHVIEAFYRRRRRSEYNPGPMQPCEVHRCVAGMEARRRLPLLVRAVVLFIANDNAKLFEMEARLPSAARQRLYTFPAALSPRFLRARCWRIWNDKRRARRQNTHTACVPAAL